MPVDIVKKTIEQKQALCLVTSTGTELGDLEGLNDLQRLIRIMLVILRYFTKFNNFGASYVTVVEES